MNSGFLFKVMWNVVPRTENLLFHDKVHVCERSQNFNLYLQGESELHFFDKQLEKLKSIPVEDSVRTQSS